MGDEKNHFYHLLQISTKRDYYYPMTDEISEPVKDLGGRPTKSYDKYTQEMCKKICLELSKGRTLRSICRDEGMPDRQTIYNWLYINVGEVRDEAGKVIEQGFFDHYTRAREVGLDEVADETIDISDDATNDYMEIEFKNGNKKIVFDSEHVQRSKLRVDNRWKYLENMMPRKYGKNITVNDQKLNAEGDKTDQPMSKYDATYQAVLDAVKSLDE